MPGCQTSEVRAMKNDTAVNSNASPSGNPYTNVTPGSPLVLSGLSGLGSDIYQAAPDAVRAGYETTLMRFRRDTPPPLIPSELGDLGVLTGAAELVFDSFLTPSGLTAWAPAVA